jgi:hypothetical protein
MKGRSPEFQSSGGQEVVVMLRDESRFKNSKEISRGVEFLLNAAGCILATGASRPRRRLAIRAPAGKHSASGKLIGRHSRQRCLQKRAECALTD